MCAANGAHAGFGQAEVFYLAGLDQVLHSPGNVLDGHAGVDAMLIEQVDDIGPQALERRVSDLPDALRAAVQALPAGTSVGIEIEPKLGGDDDFVADRLESFAEKVLVGVRAVNFGGIED